MTSSLGLLGPTSCSPRPSVGTCAAGLINLWVTFGNTTVIVVSESSTGCTGEVSYVLIALQLCGIKEFVIMIFVYTCGNTTHRSQGMTEIASEPGAALCTGD